jgi:hypothetical protein
MKSLRSDGATFGDDMTPGLDGRLIAAMRALEAVFQELKVNAVPK